MSLPGVATRRSAPAANSKSCGQVLHLHRCMHDTPERFDIFEASSKIWDASSRVGASTRAHGSTAGLCIVAPLSRFQVTSKCWQQKGHGLSTPSLCTAHDITSVPRDRNAMFLNGVGCSYCMSFIFRRRKIGRSFVWRSVEGGIHQHLGLNVSP